MSNKITIWGKFEAALTGVNLLHSKVGEQQSPQCFAICEVGFHTHTFRSETNQQGALCDGNAVLYLQCKCVAKLGTKPGTGAPTFRPKQHKHQQLTCQRSPP